MSPLNYLQTHRIAIISKFDALSTSGCGRAIVLSYSKHRIHRGLKEASFSVRKRTRASNRDDVLRTDNFSSCKLLRDDSLITNGKHKIAIELRFLFWWSFWTSAGEAVCHTLTSFFSSRAIFHITPGTRRHFALRSPLRWLVYAGANFM